MNSVVVERDLESPNYLILALLIFSIAYFLLIENFGFILSLLLAGFVYCLSRSTPVEYFWANEAGIEFHTGKRNVSLIPWSDVDQIALDRDPEDNSEVVEIRLKLKLKEGATYVRSSGVLKTRLSLYLGKKSRDTFEKLRALQGVFHEAH